jgi:small nuclear ribonucleoprotein (snRNP)-like protein
VSIAGQEDAMRKCERVIAVTILFFFVPAACGDWLTILGAASRQNPAVARQQVALYGVGAGVKVKLASGEKLKGSIGAIDAGSFDLIVDREGLTRPITYDEVTELKVNSTYRASGPPNAAEARAVAAGLGVGRHVAVKVTSGKTFRGHLQAFNEAHFVLRLDREAGPIEIAYGEVQQLGPNLSTRAKTAIWLAAVTVVIVWAYKTFSVTRGTD